MVTDDKTTFFQMAGPPEEAPEFDTLYYAISGRSVDDCVFLGIRTNQNDGFMVHHSESWVLSAKRTRATDANELTYDLHLGTQGRFTDIWRSQNGPVFVSEASGRLYRTPNLGAVDARATWETDMVDSTAKGIWGTSEHSVYTWGDGDDGRPRIFRFDGEQWSPFPAPPFRISTLTGLSDEHIWAGGQSGGLGVWDGSQWRVFATRTTENLLAIAVVSEHEVYVGGNHATIFEGSVNGIFPVGSIPDGIQGDLVDLAYWNDELWVACGPIGLYKRQSKTSQFEEVDSGLPSESLAREPTPFPGWL